MKVTPNLAMQLPAYASRHLQSAQGARHAADICFDGFLERTLTR